MSTAPRMAVVIMGYRNASTIETAVRSVLEQEAPEPFEVVVVTSGGDATAAVVRQRFPTVGVVESPTRLLPGGARNAGIEATSAGLVAFLAADCTAMPGWIARRMHHHRHGRRAVASAIVAGVDDGLVGQAAAFLLFPGRLSGHREGPANHAQSFGLSYDRALLDELGPFDASLRIGEDSVMVARLRTLGVTPWFDPAIRTAHPGPSTMRSLLRDQYERGRLRYEWEAMKAPGRGRRRFDAARSRGERVAVAAGLATMKTWSRARHTARESRAGAHDRSALIRSAPLMAMGVVASQVGWGTGLLRSANDRLAPAGRVDDAVRRSLPPTGRYLALTFEDQPRRTTPALLDRLADLDVVATFFVAADRIRGQEDIIRRMIADGHEVGIQVRGHQPGAVRDVESPQRMLRRSAAMLSQVTNWPVSLLRPAEDCCDTRLVRAAADAGLTTWLWTIDATESVLDGEVEGGAHAELAPGAVFRIAAERGQRGGLERFVGKALEQGYRFLTLPAPRSLPVAPAGLVGVAEVAGR